MLKVPKIEVFQAFYKDYLEMWPPLVANFLAPWVWETLYIGPIQNDHP